MDSPRLTETAAMTAWENQTRSLGGLIQPLPARAKRILCLDAIGLCLASFKPLPEEALGAPSASLARRALDLLRQRADHSPDEEFLSILRALRERNHSSAAATLVMALTQYSDAVSDGLSASDVLVVMSACYAAVLRAERDQTPTRLITAQRTVIDAAAFD